MRTLSLFLALAVGLAAGPVAAQGTDAPRVGTSPARASEVRTPAARRDRGNQRLEAVRSDLKLARERREALREQIDALGADLGGINRALVTVADSRQRTDERVAETERRLLSLSEQESTIRDEIDARRSDLTRILAALQRMGASPPPALLVRPDDALAAVRGAMMMNAAIPHLQRRTAALRTGLAAFDRVRAEIAGENERLRAQLSRLAEDEERLALLVEAKRKTLDRSRTELEAEQRRAASLAERARSLSGLIADLEGEIASAREAAERARTVDRARARAEAERLEEARRAIVQAREEGGPILGGVFRDAARVEPAVAFGRAKGLLPRPVGGSPVRLFGERLDDGRTALNVAWAPRPGARVRSPADGWVVYSGPFRSFGKLLILNAGGGYHVVLMGLERVDVASGQFVLAGEPVGAMSKVASVQRSGDTGQSDETVTSGSIEAPPARLYVEFRHDGRPVDPAPWWASGEAASSRTGEKRSGT